MTTFSSAILFTTDQHDGAVMWKKFLRIEDDGTLEFADCHHVVRQLNGRNNKPGAQI
jgi:hypothetical protein